MNASAPSRRILPVTMALGMAFVLAACGGDDGGGEPDIPEGPSELEMAIVEEMNLARADPKAYAETYIAPRQSGFSALYFNECMDEMKAMAPVGSLSHVDGLWRMAKTHALTQGQAGEVGHDRVDGTTFSDAARQFGASFSYVGENISYGVPDARGVVIQLLVDDGVESRGHRKNLLNGRFTQTGVGCADHATYRIECVIDYGENWVDAQR